MKIAAVIHWKTNHAPGIRGFSERAYAERRVTRAKGRLQDLHEADGVWIYWPSARGAFPSRATLAQWEQEYDAHLAQERSKPTLEQEVETLKQRLAAVEAQ